MTDILIEGGRALHGTEFHDTSLAVTDGVIGGSPASGALLLDARDLRRNAAVHVVRRRFIDGSERIFQCIFIHPNAGGKIIAPEIFQRGLKGFLTGVGSF